MVSICDIELLISVSKAAARPKHRNALTGKLEVNTDAEMYGLVGDVKRRRFIPVERNIKNKGYVLWEAIVQAPGEENPDITAVCYCPEADDKTSPVAIGFKGTETYSDVQQDVHIARPGYARQKALDEAWQFYLNAKRAFPDQEIVLTGHSLGGHYAQYIAARAYQEGHTGVFLRTFNTAPIAAECGNTLQGHMMEGDNLSRINHFVNYRTDADPVSGAATAVGRGLDILGDIYSFKTSTDIRRTHPGIDPHKTDIMHLSLTNETRSLQVGSSKNLSCELAHFIEKLHLMTEAYEFRVQGEYFSKYRSGEKDVARFALTVPKIEEAIKRRNYSNAMKQLDALQRKVEGKSPYRIVQSLIDELTALDLSLARKPEDIPPEPKWFDYYKAEIVKVFPGGDKDDTYEQDDEDNLQLK